MDDSVRWYVMHHNRANPEKIRARLTRLGIEFFQPQQYVLREVNGRKKKVLEYVLTNYFFLHASFDRLKPLTDLTEPFRLAFNLNICSGKQNDYLVVPDDQMRNFMLMASAYDAHPQYVAPQDIDLKRGQRVRIIGGPLNDYTGIYMQVRRGQKRRLVLVIDGVTAVTCDVDPDFVELID